MFSKIGVGVCAILVLGLSVVPTQARVRAVEPAELETIAGGACDEKCNESKKWVWVFFGGVGAVIDYSSKSAESETWTTGGGGEIKLNGTTNMSLGAGCEDVIYNCDHLNAKHIYISGDCEIWADPEPTSKFYCQTTCA